MGKELESIRVFISSTFRDMHAERDYLNRYVFPELSYIYRRRGLPFEAIDLRWGVTEQESQSGQALRKCLLRIKECPFFLCLLGDRYGWVPEPNPVAIPSFLLDEVRRTDQEVERVRHQRYELKSTGQYPSYRLLPGPDLSPKAIAKLSEFLHDKLHFSITAQEIFRAVMSGDDNAPLPLFYLRHLPCPDPTIPDEIAEKLGTIFQGDTTRNAEALIRLKNQIGEWGEAGRCKVSSYDATFAGLRIDPSFLPEELPSDLEAESRKGLIRFDTWANLSDKDQIKIKTLLDIAINAVDTSRLAIVALTGLDDLGEKVFKDLSETIDSWLKRIARGVPVTDINAEQAFAKSRTHNFVGRRVDIDKMKDYVADSDNHRPFVVTGEPGCGKSTLMAKFVEELRQSSTGDELIVETFIGATPGSTSLTRTLRYLCRTLKEECSLDEEIPEDPQKLRSKLGPFLRMASENRKVIIVIDALNQLEQADRAHELDWLPFNLSEHAKVLVSTLEGECLERLKKRVPEGNIHAVGDLSEEDTEKLANDHLRDKGKGLDERQMKALLTKKEVRRPLYLLVALEELCLFGLYELVLARIERLPQRISELFEQVLHRVEHDFGRDFTEVGLRWIGASRYGLPESEMVELLERRGEADWTERKWQRFYRALQFYLRPVDEEKKSKTEGPDLVYFYHNQIRDAAYGRYFKMSTPEAPPSEILVSTHKELANYFESVGRDADDSARWNPSKTRSLTQVVFHQVGGEMWDEVEDTLCDLRFMEAKCQPGIFHHVLEDYSLTLAALPEVKEEARQKENDQERLRKYVDDLIRVAKGELPLDRLEVVQSVKPLTKEERHRKIKALKTDPRLKRLYRVRAFANFAHQEGHLLAKYGCHPGFCVQTAYNHAKSGPVSEAADALVHEEGAPPMLLLTEAQRPPETPLPALLKTLVAGHEYGVTSVSISPDGKRALSGGGDNNLRVWDLETGEQIGEPLIGHKGSVDCLSVTPDWKRAVSGSIDNTLLIWNLETGEQIGEPLKGHEERVICVSITPDARRAVCLCGDKTVRVWNLETREQVGEPLEVDKWRESLIDVSLTPDGKRAVSGSDTHIVRVWDLETGDQMGDPLKGSEHHMIRVSITPDGKKAIFLSQDGTLRAWDLVTGKQVGEEIGEPAKGHQNRVKCVTQTADGKRALSGSDNHTLRLWDLETGEQVGKPLTGHEDNVICVSITPDGKRAVSGSYDGTLRVWNLETGEQVGEPPERHQERVDVVSITPDGKKALSGGYEDDALRVWDLETGEQVGEPLNDSPVNCVSITPDGKRALSGSSDNTLRVWDLETREQIGEPFTGHEGSVDCVSITPDGKRAVSASSDKTLRVWDLETMEQIGESLKGNNNSVYWLSITPDGKRAVSASSDKTLRVWDLETMEQIGESLKGNNNSVYWLSITPDGKRAVSLNRDKTLRIWDLETGEPFGEPLSGHEGSVDCVNITPDGKRAVSGGRDKALRVRDLETGQQVGEPFTGHEDWVSCVNITPDGKRAVSGSRDNTLRVWDLETGHLEAIFDLGSSVETLGLSYAVIMAGLQNGRTRVCRFANVGQEASIVTARRLWLYEDPSRYGKWSEIISATCAWCGREIVTDQALLASIAGSSRSSIRGSVDGNLSGQGYKVSCPHCEKPIRFNPFVVDNSALYADFNQVARALLKAESLAASGEIAGAELLFRKALAHAQERLGENHMLVSRCASGLAKVLEGKGEISKSNELFYKAVKIRLSLVDREFASVLAKSEERVDNLDEHELVSLIRYERRRLIAHERVFGSEDPRILPPLDRLSELEAAKSEWSDAKQTLRRALAIRRHILGGRHEETAGTMTKLASCLIWDSVPWDERKNPEALDLIKKALEIRVRELGPKAAATLESLFWYCVALIRNNKPEKSREFFRKWLTITGKEKGFDHLDIARGLHDYAGFCFQMDLSEKAQEWFAKAAEIFRQNGQILKSAEAEFRAMEAQHKMDRPVDLSRLEELVIVLKEAGSHLVDGSHKLLRELTGEQSG